MPKISVIIPVYNVEKYLRQCLDSVVNQTLKDIEIICVNDCSTDNSLSILKEYTQNDDRIKIIDLKENVGPGIARNRALDIAKGEYIMLLDPDDWYELNACESLYHQINENKNDLVVFNYREYIESDNMIIDSKYRIEPFLPFVDQKCFSFNDLDKNWFKNAFCVVQIYNKDFLNKNEIRYSHYKLCEDGLFFTKAIICSRSISVLNKVLYNYRVREAGDNQSAKKDLWKELLCAKKIAFEYAKEHCNKTEILPHLIFYIQTLMFWFNQFNQLPYFELRIFFNTIKRVFTELENEYKVSKIDDTGINIKKYQKFINEPYELYFLKSIPKKILSISNIYLGENIKQKCITILGKKFKLIRVKKDEQYK